MSNRRRRKSSSGGDSDWMNTYADMVTLLLTFFILLFSMSSMDAKKFEAVASAFKSILQGESGSTIMDMTDSSETPIVGEMDQNILEGESNEYREIYKEIKELIDKNNLGGVAKVKGDVRGVVIELQDQVLFDSGKAQIKDSSITVLEKIQEVIGEIPNPIEIQGHTDNVPISNATYKDNFTLSGARAYSVLDFYKARGIPGSRLSYRGMGEFSPIVPNDTDANRSTNRRVNILIEVPREGNN